ncbi:MAG: phosphatidylglycerol lysyltransferase domain-containing protein [Chlamydiota bacterium]
MISPTNIETSLDRARVVELVRKWAEVNTDGILDKTTQIFSVPHIEGLVGYRIELGNAVVYGDPVCSPTDKVSLAKEFANYCQSKKLKPIYIIVSEEFAHLAGEFLSFSLIEFGKKFVLNPLKHCDSPTTLLRKKVRQSTKHGVEICEHTCSDPLLEEEMGELAAAWVNARKGIQIYLAEPTIFDDRVGKRWFYAKREGKVIGFVVLNRLFSRDGWLLNNVMVAKNSPSGVSEHLVFAAMQALQKEECPYVLIGPVPAKDLGKITGIGKTIASITRWVYKGVKKTCHLDGHEIFWDKFQPELGSSYLLFPRNKFRPTSIFALLRALNISLS